MTIQQTISKLTLEIWENIYFANQLNTKYGEETISDVLLLELARLKNYNLRILQTPKDKEKYKGTDWGVVYRFTVIRLVTIRNSSKKSQSKK